MTGDRPDSSLTAGKTEEEVSALKAAACKEVIAVINVRPMRLVLDSNMGHGIQVKLPENIQLTILIICRISL